MKMKAKNPLFYLCPVRAVALRLVHTSVFAIWKVTMVNIHGAVPNRRCCSARARTTLHSNFLLLLEPVLGLCQETVAAGQRGLRLSQLCTETLQLGALLEVLG